MESPHLRFDNQVALVTGAGGGLGKAYALLFASRGARVVVNDLGGASDGQGSNSRPADIVVDEIRKRGGSAVADYNSVEDGSKIIETALNNFGRIDIIINNAGILRDRSFARISDTDWDLVHRVHLRGAFMVTRAAWPHMKQQKYGRIIMTSSAAGLYGNFGQGNYSAAKMGLVGLSNTLAIEGQKYNIHCNALIPTSGTRLTQGLIPDDTFKAMTPDTIAPLVVWLCHSDCEDSGEIFAAAVGWYGKYRMQRTNGFLAKSKLSDVVSPETIRDNWNSITNFTDPVDCSAITREMGDFIQMSNQLKENEEKANLVQPVSTHASGPLAAVGKEAKSSFTYDSLEVILYALGVGCSTKDKNGLKFLYEGDEEFCVLPTYAILPVLGSLMESSFFSKIPGWNIDLTKLLHGEQYLKLKRPLPTSGKLQIKKSIVDVLDKGSGALILVNFDICDEEGEDIASGQMTTFIVGDGNFGGPRSTTKQISVQKAPARSPDAVASYTTSVDQAALYRLSGDRNPLHINPDFAAMGGFKEPILHGLCSYGISAKAVLKRFCNDDVSKFKAIMGRFASPVIPGQTLLTSMWKEGNRVFYETKVKETGKVCIAGGYVDIEGGEIEDSVGQGRLKTNEFFKGASANIQYQPYKGPNTLVLWNILDGQDIGAMWTFDLRSESGCIYSGLPNDGSAPSGSISIQDDDLMDIFNGDSSPSKAFLTGKLKLTGDILNVKGLMSFFIPQSQL